MREKNRGFLSRNQLKYIAMILMVLDHVGAAFLPGQSIAYFVLRYVFGRSAFPIFCVLFVDGFLRTKRPWTHVRDCLVFALLSEIPFDIVIGKNLQFPFFDFGQQNVMFTWLLGFLMCMVLRKFYDLQESDNQVSFVSVICVSIGLFLCCSWLATVCNLDYMFVGVSCVYCAFMLYRISDKSVPIWVVGLFVALIDGFCSGTFWTLPSVLILMCYDANKCCRWTKLSKYIFYGFYPAHLVVIGVLLLVQYYF